MQIRFRELTYEVRDGESVLDALIRGGADVVHSCRKGSCHSCVLRSCDATPAAESQAPLESELAETGHFLPCLCHPTESMTVAPPDQSVRVIEAMVAEVSDLGAGVTRVLLEPTKTIDWRGGHFFSVTLPDAPSRSYSAASLADEDYFLELHVREVEGGEVSHRFKRLQPGETVELQGPFGKCLYDESMTGRSLVLIATGTGVAPLWTVLRDAVRRGHTGPVSVRVGARTPSDHYFAEQLEAFCDAHEIEISTHFSRAEHSSRVTDDLVDTLSPDAIVYAFGNPSMVHDVRVAAVAAGVDRKRIFTDPFEDARPYQPDDRAKIANYQPDPELWAALDHGPGLRAVLEDFYTRAYDDEILAPFFHNVTKQRAVSKQYEFLSNIFGDQPQFLGMRPFNAHHWMVITDEIFDHREALMESCLRRWGLPEHHIRTWNAFHEMWRPEIVKSAPRGLIRDGIEEKKHGFEVTSIGCATVCDGCVSEIDEGATVRMHRRTGEVFCEDCNPRYNGLGISVS